MEKDKIIVQEYFRIVDNIKIISNIFLQLIAVPIAAIFASFILLKDLESAALILPFLIAYGAYLLAKYTIKIVEYRLYAQYLEEKINKIYNENILIEETFNRKFFIKHRDYLQLCFIAPVGFFSLYFFIPEFVKCFLVASFILKAFLLLLLLFLIIAIGVIVYISFALKKTFSLNLDDFKDKLYEKAEQDKKTE